MAEKPILFSGPMVRAILEGRKTKTRRVVDMPPMTFDAIFNDDGVWYAGDALTGHRYAKLPVRYRTGDRLWVRERFTIVPATAYRMSAGVQQTINPNDPDWAAIYAEGWDRSIPQWKPSIHMPRWASRITLVVTEVRVQRLQEIGEEDAKAEGAEMVLLMEEWVGGSTEKFRRGFRKLWESIHGPGAWEANPWVAAISFERVS
ncbi:hypothetical protein [Aestuariivirga sp.]|uniref:hypothetical protein n=1 Tax=Aestuariivirga sp. TaxID=2650926 RepID=UPI0039E608B9